MKGRGREIGYARQGDVPHISVSDVGVGVMRVVGRRGRGWTISVSIL